MRAGGCFPRPGSGRRRERRGSCRARTGRSGPSASIATSGRSSRTTASPATAPTRSSARRSSTSTRKKAPSLEEGIIVPGSAAKSVLVKMITHPDPDERMPPADSGHSLTPAQIELAAALDRRRREVGYALGVHGAGTARAAGDAQGPRVGRGTRSTASSSRGSSAKAEAVAGGRQGDAAAPRHLRSDGTAADAGRSRRVPGRPLARRVREARRRAAAVAALRRAHGGAVARRGALRRHARLSHRQPARHVAVARLGHRRLQPQSALRPVHRSSSSPAICSRTRRASRRSPPGSTATT